MSAESFAFPLRSEELRPELIERALQTLRPDVEVAGLEVVAEAHCESGSASTAGRAELRLQYAIELGLPERMILKTVLVRPGAPSSMYENEVRFYRELRPELEIETPRCHAAIFDRPSGTFGLLLEDVRERGAAFQNATQSMDEAQIRSALTQLAAQHARFWESPRFAHELDWLWTPRSGGFFELLQGPGAAMIQGLIAKSEYKQSLLVRLDKSFDELWSALWSAQALLDTEPRTLLHGDAHFGNTYLLPVSRENASGVRVGFVDWQLLIRGRWAHDVTYLLMTSLDIEMRRRLERELIAEYLDALRAGGVRNAPGRDEAWRLYRQTAIWGFLIGWMICPVENYGDAITEANLNRLATALEDLETFRALEE